MTVWREEDLHHTRCWVQSSCSTNKQKHQQLEVFNLNSGLYIYTQTDLSHSKSPVCHPWSLKVPTPRSRNNKTTNYTTQKKNLQQFHFYTSDHIPRSGSLSLPLRLWMSLYRTTPPILSLFSVTSWKWLSRGKPPEFQISTEGGRSQRRWCHRAADSPQRGQRQTKQEAAPRTDPQLHHLLSLAYNHRLVQQCPKYNKKAALRLDYG